jgi:hypothetical protein
MSFDIINHMKTKSLKELRLGVGISPASSPSVKRNNFVSLGGFHKNADDVFQNRYSLVNKEEEELEETGDEVPEDILEFRVYRNNQYQLTETLENIDEGILQKGLDLLKAVPGLDQVVGDIELYMQAGEVKDAFDSLSNIVSSLKHVAGLSALAIVGTENQFGELLSKFVTAEEEDKITLREGVEKLLDILKNMTITAAQTFDSIVALPTFAAAGVGGVVGETIANIVTSIGTFLRDQPIEQFVFKTLSERTGIISKVVELFEKVFATITGGGAIGKALGFVIDKISKAGGEIVELFLTKPFELLRRLGDLYKAAIGEPVENASMPEIDVDADMIDKLPDVSSQIFENTKYSILFLLEGFDEGGPASTKKYDDSPLLKGRQSELPDALQKGIINKAKKKKKKNELDHSEEEFQEIDLGEFSGAGAIAGYAVPQPGPNPNKPNTKKAQTAHHKLLEKQKEINEQRRRISLLQAYHQKTTNRLK